MSWLGDLLKFEGFNAKQMLGQIKDKPQRLLYGSADPFSTGVWNKILGTDDKPIVDQWGGAAPQRYGEAEAAGINSRPGHQGHQLARMIASFYAGGAAGNAMGLGGGAAGGAGEAASTGTTAIPNSVNLVNAGGTMSTGSAGTYGGSSLAGGAGGMSGYLKNAGEAAGIAKSTGLLDPKQQQQPAQSVDLRASSDPIGDLLRSQSELEEQRRQARGLLGGRYGGNF